MGLLTTLPYAHIVANMISYHDSRGLLVLCPRLPSAGKPGVLMHLWSVDALTCLPLLLCNSWSCCSFVSLLNFFGNMSNYQKLGQVEEDASSDNDKHADPLKPSFLERRNFGKFLIISHIIIFGLYALSVLYLLKRDPSDRACDYKHSTHCQYQDFFSLPP